MPEADPPLTSRPGGGALGCIAFGLYLMAGASLAFTGHWPGFLPPQMDGIALLFSWLPEPNGTYVAGAVTGLLGVGCVAFGIALWTSPAASEGEGERSTKA